MLEHKRVFITGGSGFIAPHLLAALCTTHSVVLHVRDARKSGQVHRRPGLVVYSGKLGDDALRRQISGGFDAVLHLAGAVVGPSVEAVLESNIVTTNNVLSLMEACGIPKIVFMSTASVWSDSAGQKLDERTATNPSTVYGYAKLAAECLINDAVAAKKIASAAILRCNNTYGPGCVQGVVASFRSRILSGQPVQIHGDGQQLREPLHVADLVDAILKAMSLSEGLRTYGISGPEALTVLNIAETIAGSLGRELQVEWRPEHPERTRHLILNTEKARRELDWVPRVRFSDGVRTV